MNEEQKSQLIAEAENVEAIREFFTQWWSSADLYETSAKACDDILHLASNGMLSQDELKDVEKLIEQHMMLIDLVKPFESKEGEI